MQTLFLEKVKVIPNTLTVLQNHCSVFPFRRLPMSNGGNGGMVREGPRKWPPLGFDSLDHQREVTFCSCSVSLKGKSSPTSPYTPHIKMTNGHKRGRVNPAASLELRRERNRRYYVKHKAAKKPSSTNVAEPTEAVASTFAANPLQMDATILEIPQGQSASKPHIKMPSGHNTGCADPSASLERRNASLERRRERNRRYYVKHKAAKKPSSTNVAESTEAVASTFAANPSQMDATIPEIPQGQSASTPHIKMPSGHNTGRADPSASLERRRERNRSMTVTDFELPYKKRKWKAVGELPPREEPISSL